METLRGAQLLMSDGTSLTTEVVSDEDSHLCLYVLLQDMLKVGDMVVGFEMEWGFKSSSSSSMSRSGSTSGRSISDQTIPTPDKSSSENHSTTTTTHSSTRKVVEHHIALLTLCTKLGCVLIRLSPKSISASLKRFLGIKDIVFVGVHVKEDVMKLKEAYGLVIRNCVELSEWAAKIYDHPRFVFYSGRELAHKLIYIKFEPKPYTIMWSNWFDPNLSSEQIECAAADAFAAYKVGKKLMESSGGAVKRLFAKFASNIFGELHICNRTFLENCIYTQLINVRNSKILFLLLPFRLGVILSSNDRIHKMQLLYGARDRGMSSKPLYE